MQFTASKRPQCAILPLVNTSVAHVALAGSSLSVGHACVVARAAQRGDFQTRYVTMPSAAM